MPAGWEGEERRQEVALRCPGAARDTLALPTRHFEGHLSHAMTSDMAVDWLWSMMHGPREEQPALL